MRTIPDRLYYSNRVKRKKYLLEATELDLFEEFCIQQEIAMQHMEADFVYSLSVALKELNLKRRSYNAVVNKFLFIGFLTCEDRVKDKNGGGKFRYFKVDFSLLAKDTILSQILRKDTKEDSYYQQMKSYFREIAALQKERSPIGRKESVSYKEAKRLYAELEDVYNSRIDLLNKEAGRKKKDHVQLQTFSKYIQTGLCNLLNVYSVQSIKYAFIAYSDAIVKGEICPNNVMRYFLTNSLLDESVFSTYLDKSKTYSYG